MDSKPQTGYERFDDLIRQLRIEGHHQAAETLNRLLHEVAWTTSSELLGELGLAIAEFERARPKVSSEMRTCLDSCKKLVRRAWPGLK